MMHRRTQQQLLSEEDTQRVANVVGELYLQRKRSTVRTGLRPRLLIAIAGRPGSGKTSVATYISQALRGRLLDLFRNTSEATDPIVCVMSMDGYHLTRAELRAMPDAEEAFSRRGAEWTFNPSKLCEDLQKIRTPGSTGEFSTVWVPTFDHSVGDPCERGTFISPDADIVLIEGNYLLYRGTPEWAAVSRCFDFRIFLECPRDVCTERLCRRHMAAWNIDRTAAMKRAGGSDTTNGDLVDTTRRHADLMVHSVNVEFSRI